jgi:hypothetical protein
VAALLRSRHIPFAVVGATAMAVHGVSRSTRDTDVLVASRECLVPTTWEALAREGVSITVRSGDESDPLAGVVRLVAEEGLPLDVVIGRSRWQATILERATSAMIDDVVVPVARAADLILLKLFAGGPQDAWDVTLLLAGPDRLALIAEVEAALPVLPDDARQLWRRVLGTP